MIDLDALEALANAATPGDWLVNRKIALVFVDTGTPDCPETIADVDTGANAEFIAAARTAVPELIARVRALEEEQDALRELASEAFCELGPELQTRARALGVLPKEEM